MEKAKKANIKREVVSAFFILLGAFINACSMHIFMIPAKFAPGGVSGLASIFQNLVGFSASYTLLILNAPLLVAAFFLLSRKFFFKTTASILLSSAFLKLFEITNFYTFFDENSVILSALVGGSLMGLGTGILVKFGASTGGTDIISLLVQRKSSSLRISWMLLIMNIFVITLGGILYVIVGNLTMTNTLTVVMYSFLGVFLSSKVMDIVLNGTSSAVKFEIITSKAQEISDAIIQHLHRGVTIVDSHGAYTKSENKIVICIVTRRQIAPLRRILREVDSSAFVFAMDTREVLGNGFTRKK